MISKYLNSIAVGTVIAAIAILAAPGAWAQLLTCKPDPQHATCDPCRIFDDLVAIANSDLLDLDEGIKSFISLLSSDVADLDGSFFIDDTGENLVATLSGDDMRDVSNQMELVEFIMDTNPAGLPVTGAEIKAAFNANYLELEQKIGPQNLVLIGNIARPVIPALTYLTMLGKESDFAVIESEDPIKTHGQGTLGILQALLVFLSGVDLNGVPLNFADTTVNPGDFIIFGDLLAPDADLDSDGFSNICEYRHFRKNVCKPATFTNLAPNDNNDIGYLEAVINPAITPVGCYIIEAPEDDCSVPLTKDAVVPPSTSDAQGTIRFRHFENTVTGAERFQVNFFHTVESAAPSAQFIKGLPGVAGSEVLVNIPNASPAFWEVYIGPVNAQRLRTTSNYFSVFGTDPPAEGQPPVTTEWLRGDNSCGVLAPPPPVPHDADENGNYVIEIEEILPVIEFINAGGFHCDGFEYVPGPDPSNQTCSPHNSDFNPQNWQMSLPELLRLVQLFSAGEYEQCIGASEDDYCISAD